MNIGFLYGSTFPPRTTGSVHGYQLSKGLAERGHTLLSWYYGSDSNPFIKHYRGRQLAGFLSRLDALYVRIDWQTRSSFLWLRKLALRRLPLVWELNGLPEDDILYDGGSASDVRAATRRLQRLALHVDAAIGVTDTITDYLRDELGIRKVRCIPNGGDPLMFRRGDGSVDPRKPLNVIWLGNASSAWHDISTILAAAELLCKEGVNVRFTLYGDRDGLPENLPDNVTCPGIVPYLDLGRHLGAADVGVVLFRCLNGRLKDGSPLKLFDYMACGLAVISQDVGQTGEVLHSTGAGIFTTGTAEDLAARIASLERDREQCKDLGMKGREAVVTHYNWQRTAAETESVLQEVVVAG